MTSPDHTTAPAPFTPTGDTPRPARSRTVWLIIGALAILLIAGATTAVVLTTRSSRDEHATAACRLLEQADGQGLLDAVVSQIKAIQEAKQSSDAELRAAATKTSAASQLPSDNPLYANPGDVQAAAVSDWCRTHP